MFLKELYMALCVLLPLVKTAPSYADEVERKLILVPNDLQSCYQVTLSRVIADKNYINGVVNFDKVVDAHGSLPCICGGRSYDYTISASNEYNVSYSYGFFETKEVLRGRIYTQGPLERSSDGLSQLMVNPMSQSIRARIEPKYIYYYLDLLCHQNL